VLAANALPLVGVAALGWRSSTLILLYWVEFTVLLLGAVLRALFAGRPAGIESDAPVVGALSRRSLRVTIPRTDVGVRASSLPVLAAAVPLLALLWFVVSAATIGIVGVTDANQEAWVLGLAVVTMVVTEAGRTGVDYFYRGGYRDHSAGTALRGVWLRGVALIAIGACSLLVAVDGGAGADSAAGAAGIPLLLGIVGLKLATDLADLYAERLAAYDEATDLPLGFAYEPPTDEAVDGVGPDAQCVRPARLGRVAGGVPSLIRHPNAVIFGVLAVPIAVLFALGRAWSLAAVVGVAAVGVPVGVSSLDHWLRYAGVEYRADGDAVVAYDRLSGEPVWRVEPWDERGLRVERDWLDARLGTETVVVELDGETRRLPHLRTPEAVLETFDRRPGRGGSGG
jgi:hypothetical protein